MTPEGGPENLDRLSRRPVAADNVTTTAHAGKRTLAPAWLLFLSGGLLLTALYIVMPYGPVAAAVYVAASLGSAALVALAVYFRPLFSPAACILLACGLGLTAAGHFIWYWLDFQGLDPFASIADIVYLAAYPLFMGALWKLGRQGMNDSDAIIDALIVGIAAAVLGWGMLIEPYVNDPHLGLLQLVVATAYPVADMILLPLIVWLLFLYRARVRAHQFLLAGMIVYLLADVLYAHGNSTGWYTPGGFTDGLWLVGYALFTGAVWHPSAAVASRFERVRARLTTGRLVILATAALVAPAVILVTAGTDIRLVRVAAIGSILLFALVMVRMAGLMNRIRRQSERFEGLARTDALTGALNRRALEHELTREVARAERGRIPLCLAFLDLDHFKRYNDTNGHAAGDALLRDVSAAWRRALRPTDVLARTGGEEFIVVVSDCDIGQCRAVVERLRALVPHDQTCSAGIARFQHGDTPDSLIRRADEALYAAKNGGRDQAVVAEEQVTTGTVGERR
ncbi:MAG: GGDEF domain-containing protein [Halofilum sp. (in: g-proteobacteria)]|nr:GGDEF domain-containing protein [Halofilum sp. (in: g-proteobacteria)]